MSLYPLNMFPHLSMYKNSKNALDKNKNKIFVFYAIIWHQIPFFLSHGKPKLRMRWFLNYMKNSNIIPAKLNPRNWHHKIMQLNASKDGQHEGRVWFCASIQTFWYLVIFAYEIFNENQFSWYNLFLKNYIYILVSID